MKIKYNIKLNKRQNNVTQLITSELHKVCINGEMCVEACDREVEKAISNVCDLEISRERHVDEQVSFLHSTFLQNSYLSFY